MDLCVSRSLLEVLCTGLGTSVSRNLEITPNNDGELYAWLDKRRGCAGPSRAICGFVVADTSSRCAWQSKAVLKEQRCREEQ